MDSSATAGLIGAAIGALSGIGGGYLTSKLQARTEREKWLRSRRDEQEKNLLLAVAELAKKLAVGTHTIAWFTWKAKSVPDELGRHDVATYNKDMKGLFPEIVGSRAVVVALDKIADKKVSHLITRLYALDVIVASAALQIEEDKTAALHNLAWCYDEALKLDEELLTTVSVIMRLDSASNSATHN